MRGLIQSAVAISTALVLALPAAAAGKCMCQAVTDDTRTALSRHDAVFVGRLVGTRLDDTGEKELHLHTFRIEESLKGANGDELTARASPRGVCNKTLMLGERYLVWLREFEDGTLPTLGFCNRTARLGKREAEKDLKILRAP